MGDSTGAELMASKAISAPEFVEEAPPGLEIESRERDILSEKVAVVLLLFTNSNFSIE
jgi:hypothetical protein